MIYLDQELQEARIDEANHGDCRPLTEHERDSIKRMMGVGQVIMDDVADLLPTSNDVRLTDDRSFTMLAISIIAAVSFVLGVAVGAVMWMLT